MALTAEWDTYNQATNTRIARHELEIIDTQGNLSGTFSIDFNNGFELIDGGTPKDLWPTIKPRSCRFTMKVTNNSHYTLVRNIGTSSDINRFIVRYRRNRAIQFVGVILTEATTLVLNAPIEVNSVLLYDGSFVVTAVDGLTLLQGTTFYTAGDRLTFRSILAMIMVDLPTKAYLSATPFAFQTSWVPDTGTANFILNQVISPLALGSEGERLGGATFIPNYEVLKMICEHFNMFVRYTQGVYFFQQLEDIHASIYGYGVTMNFKGVGPSGLGTQTVGSDGIKMIAPEITTWTPPIREVKVKYNTGFNPNLTLGNKFDIEVPDTLLNEVCYNDITQVPIKTSQVRLRIIATIEFTPKQGDYSGEVKVVFYFKIKLGNQYFARELFVPGDYNNYVYKPTEWTATDSLYYEIYDYYITAPHHWDEKFYLPVYFSTRYVPESLDDEQLSLCFGYELYDEENNQLPSGDIKLVTYVQDMDVAAIDTENNLVETVAREVLITNNPNNQKSISRTLLFSTGTNTGSQNRITDDSSPPIDTENWTVPGLGTDYHYNQVAKSLMSRGMKASTWMGTTVEGPYLDKNILVACGAEWLWWAGSYYINDHQEFRKGEFLKVGIDPVGLSIDEEDLYDIVERPPFPTKGTGSPFTPKEIEITGIVGSTINADTFKIPMPDTEGWSDERIRSIVTYNRSGNVQRYKDPPTILNEFAWDNTNRNFVLAENSQAILWHIFRVYR